MKDALIKMLRRAGYVPRDAGGLFAALRLPHGRRTEFLRLVGDLERSGEIVRIKGGTYALPAVADLIPGQIRMNRQGRGFLVPDDPKQKEVVIPSDATGTALHEDRVLVRLDITPMGLAGRPEGPLTGSVIRILERTRACVVGTLRSSGRFLHVVPDDPRIPHEIMVPGPGKGGRTARVGDKVVVRFRGWESRQTSPEGEIIEVLGAPSAPGVDMASVLRQYELPLQFPKLALQEARAMGTAVTQGDLAGREDCRRHRVITIDPDDARDFDDAIALERAAAGQWRLWVHVADVSHYVKPGSALDAEALRRGNSTYLVDRVIPMLPEALSNELCSLKPGVDRLTKCVEFLLADDGRVLRSRFYPAVIRSQRRFTYREAMAIIDGMPGGAIEGMVRDAHVLAQRIRARRFKSGALELDSPEIKLRLDANGAVREIERIQNDASHQLIEEFMLLANEAVASRLVHLRRAAIHRIHEAPEERRLAEYRTEVLRHQVPCGVLRDRAEIQKLLHRLGGLPIGPALKIGFLRSMTRARYSMESSGHFGLAKAHYTHFTSPIRRYADLVVHRALFEHGSVAVGRLPEVTRHISQTERNSADAERASRDLKMMAYLERQLRSGRPEVYEALVTDVRNFGFFVDVTGLGMSGLVPLSGVKEDFFVFDPARGRLVGRRSRREIRLGDRLRVVVAVVDGVKKQVDFRLASERGDARPRPAPRTVPRRPPERPGTGGRFGPRRERGYGSGRRR